MNSLYLQSGTFWRQSDNWVCRSKKSILIAILSLNQIKTEVPLFKSGAYETAIEIISEIQNRVIQFFCSDVAIGRTKETIN